MKCRAGWITSWNHNLQEKYQQPQIGRWCHPNGRKWRGTKEPLDESEEKSEKSGFKLNSQKTKIMVSSPIASRQIDGKKVERATEFLFLGSQITAVTAVMKLKDACPVEEKLWQSYGFSSSHVQMWEMNHKEGRVPKNWMLLSCGAEEDS